MQGILSLKKVIQIKNKILFKTNAYKMFSIKIK